MEKSFYNIYRKDGKSEIGKGFFCHINYENEKIPIIIISGLELYEEDLDCIIIYKNNEKNKKPKK